ncbi:MAG: S41 family peptidase [Gammaproteobacteria bacterium]|nr:S41 family peptidase [Gammaproteobacteria bacterium]
MKNRAIKLSALLISLTLGSCISFADPADTSTPSPATTSSSPETAKALDEVDINRFVDTITTIKNNYAKTINDQKLLENAIRGMVNNLDPHSEYLDENAYKALMTTTSGAFGGLGIEVSSEYGVLKVVTPIDDTPAAKAGIKSGDYIVALDGKLVNEMTGDQAVDAMRGKEGSPIVVTIIRPGQKEPLKFNILRAMIHTDSLKSKLLETDFGYIRISQFQEPTGDLLITAINNLKKQAGGHLKGLVLDLRNNPGGLLETAVKVVNVFLNSDKLTQFDRKIVYTQGRVPESQYKAIATGHDLLEDAPLIILINEGSASASEIVAGALQDYHRAVIVGTTSFGKGSVQTVLPLDKNHAVKLTTALYHTPSGRLIQNQGIIPDIYIANIKVSPITDLNIDPIREFQLKDHLANKTTVDGIDADGKSITALAKEDFQLYESLNILKAMAFKPKS